MKNFALVFVILIGAYAYVPMYANAADDSLIAPLNTGGMESPIDNPSQAYNLLVTAIKWVYTIFFIIAILFILIAAYNFILGGKDEKKVQLAKNQLKYAVIAIAVALLSAGASTLVQNFLESSSGSEKAREATQENSGGGKASFPEPAL